MYVESKSVASVAGLAYFFKQNMNQLLRVSLFTKSTNLRWSALRSAISKPSGRRTRILKTLRPLLWYNLWRPPPIGAPGSGPFSRSMSCVSIYRSSSLDVLMDRPNCLFFLARFLTGQVELHLVYQGSIWILGSASQRIELGNG